MLYRFARKLFYLWFRIFNKLTFHGLENVIEDEPIVICANHISNLDPFLISNAFNRNIRFLAKKQLFDTPVVKHLAKAYGAVPVDRDAKDFGALLSCVRIVKKNEALGVFPEGTRIRNGKTAEAKGGAVAIAYIGKAKIVPVKLEFRSKRVHIFNSYTVTVGKALTCEDLGVLNKDAEAFRVAAITLMDKIYEL